MGGRRTALASVVLTCLVAVASSACDFGTPDGSAPSDDPTLVVDEAGDDVPPELTRRVAVELGTAVAVFGRGCRPRIALQRCSVDGKQTYTLASPLRAATVVGAWMQLDSGRGRWAVHLRLRPGDARAVSAVSEQTEEVGGLAVVLDAHTGDVLLSIPSPDIQGVTITGHDLQKPAAEAVVDAFVTAATGR